MISGFSVQQRVNADKENLKIFLLQLTAAPEYLYLLEMSLQNVKRDGTYHPLRVKVDNSDLRLTARRGYYAPNAAKK